MSTSQLSRRLGIAGVVAALAVSALVVGTQANAAPKPHQPTAADCSALEQIKFTGVTVTSVSAELNDTGVFTPPPTPPLPGGPPNDPITGLPAFCDVVLHLTSPGAGNDITVEVWLPGRGWNGRFQGVGGGGYAAGFLGASLAPALRNGYAAASTNAGYSVGDGSFALRPDGRLNWAGIQDYGHRATHVMTVAAKQTTAAFYRTPARYSYFNGCSNGGRQGLVAASRYPKDYDGVVADSPAVSAAFPLTIFWPQLVMRETGTYPAPCVLDAITAGAVRACDGLDGVRDGLIGDPRQCRFDPATMVGTKVECAGTTETVTAADAALVRAIWQGPRASDGSYLYDGLSVGAPLTGTAATKTGPDGIRTGDPFYLGTSFLRYFLSQDPDLDPNTVTRDQYTQYLAQASEQYSTVLGPTTDLSAFRTEGGKMITYNGWNDFLFPSKGILDYHRAAADAVGGATALARFYRLFQSPGGGHCHPAPGPATVDTLAAVVAWVEHGKAPDTLRAVSADGRMARDLCPYPLVNRYKGHGDPNSPDSFTCARTFAKPVR